MTSFTHYNVFKFLYLINNSALDDDYLMNLQENVAYNTFDIMIMDFFNFMKKNYSKVLSSKIKFLNKEYLEEQFEEAFEFDDDEDVESCPFANGLALACHIDETLRSCIGIYMYADMIIKSNNNALWEYFLEDIADSFGQDSYEDLISEGISEGWLDITDDDIQEAFNKAKATCEA